MSVTTIRPTAGLKVSNIKKIYGHHIVYLFRFGKAGEPETVWHLLCEISDFAEMEHHFGKIVAEFIPARGCWIHIVSDNRVSEKEIINHVGDGILCTLGKTCPKHLAKGHY